MSLGLSVESGLKVVFPPPPTAPKPKVYTFGPLPEIGTPSITYKDSTSPLTEDVPLILIETLAPGCPDICVAVIPATLPISAWSTPEDTVRVKVSPSTEATAPVRSLLFIVPYPTTTTSFNV